MAGPYRNNVVVEAGYTGATFDPPLDAIYVTAAPAANVTMTVSGSSVTITSSRLGQGTLFEVGDITSVASATSFAFIGLRVLNKSGSSNAVNDVVTGG